MGGSTPTIDETPASTGLIVTSRSSGSGSRSHHREPGSQPARHEVCNSGLGSRIGIYEHSDLQGMLDETPDTQRSDSHSLGRR